MTTIAYNNGLLCADTQVNSNSCVYGYASKIFEHDGVFYASCGQKQDFEQLKNWVKSGKKEDKKPSFDCSFSGMYCDGDNIYCFDDKFIPYIIEADYFAMGSGWEIATGAMEFGASAEEAVNIACKIDAFSGGKVEVYKVTKPL